MKIRTLLLGLLIAGLAQSAAVAAGDDAIQIRLHPDSPEIGVIEVDGKRDGIYNKILTDTLEYGVYVRGDQPYHAIPGTSRLSIGLYGTGGILAAPTDTWKRHTLTMPNRDLPHSTPIKLCNDRLQNLLGSQRQEFLRKGEAFSYGEAYEVLAYLTWTIDAAVPYVAYWQRSMKVPVKIKCLALNRNRQEAEGPGRSTEPVPPILWKTTLKIEPAKLVRDGKYTCPSELKLYGHVEAGRKFRGNALFVGPHYLSAITHLDFPSAGGRHVTGTYTMDWRKMGGLTAQPNTEPKKQKLTFHFNIANKDGKLLESVEKTVEVSCRKIKVAVPTVGDELTGEPVN